MKSFKGRLIILVVFALLFVGCNTRDTDKVKPINDFSIYLVKDVTVNEARTRDLEELTLGDTPVITGKNIKVYNWKEHSFSLKKGFSLEERLEGKVPLSGLPFVVVVGNERIYLGCFWNNLSSVYSPETPTIYSGWFKGNNKDTYTIECIGNQDFRGDIRIYQSLKELGAIVQ